MITKSSCVVQRVKFDRILALRHRILRPGLPVNSAIFDSDEELTTQHYAFVYPLPPAENSSVVCCASFNLTELECVPAWQLRGMATDTQHQGRGFGRALLEGAETELLYNSPAIHLFWCNARITALRFYEKMGWTIVSEVFLIEGAGLHHKMVKRIPHSEENEPF